MAFDELEENFDLQKLFLFVQDLAEAKEELQNQVEELLEDKNRTENKLINVKEQNVILEREVTKFEASISAQLDDKAVLKAKLENENLRREALEEEIQKLKSKADETAINFKDDSEDVKTRLAALEDELKQKDLDHAKTQTEFNDLSKRMKEAKVSRNKIREMQKYLVRAEKKLKNSEWERKREISERMLLEEREQELERQNMELETKLQEALKILEKRQQELKDTQLVRPPSLSETLAELEESESEEEAKDLSDEEVEMKELSDDELVGNMDRYFESDDEMVGQMKKGRLLECEICNKFVEGFNQRCFFTTERIFNKHLKSKLHRENVHRLKKNSRPLQAWNKQSRMQDSRHKRREKNSVDDTRKQKSFQHSTRKRTHKRKKHRKPPMVTNNMKVNKFKTEKTPFVEELTMEHLIKFQRTLNEVRDSSYL